MAKITKNKKSLPWDVVEKAIRDEFIWLKNTIVPSPYEKDYCTHCIYRQIAILIVSGKVTMKNITSKNNALWAGKEMTIKKSHGADWHFNMMKKIGGHFQSLGFEVEVEPTLTHGRADLGVYKKEENNLFVEVGTVSPFKLLVNLRTMINTKILLAPQEDHVVEFSVLKTDIKHDLYNPSAS